MNPRAALPVLALLAWGGFAAPASAERSRLVAPAEIGAVYSEAELQARMAFVPAMICPPEDCDGAKAFRERVSLLGQRLLPSAVHLAEEQGIEIPLIAVTVPGKDDLGTLSSAAGNVIVFDGMRALALSDTALAFVIAREMGHIIAKHHEENAGTGLAVSAAVAILFPVVGLMQGVELAYTAATTVASTATSFAGSRIVRNFYADDQRREADGYAMQILAQTGWSPREVAHALHDAEARLAGDGWLADLRMSKQWLDAIVTGPHLDAPAPAAALPVNTPAATLLHHHFGPGYDAETLWVVGLLQGVEGIQRICSGASPVVMRGPDVKSSTSKTVKQGRNNKVVKGKPTKAKKAAKPGAKRAAKPRGKPR